jgi:hypothetical protein
MPRITTKKRPFSEVVHSLRDCVFAVIRHRRIDGQNGAMPLGSGFFVSQNVFLTCYHVVNTRLAPHQSGDSYQLVNNFGQHGTSIMLANGEIGRDIHLYPESDAALLQVNGAPANQRYVALEYGDVPEGTDIGVAGYPLARLSVQNGQLEYNGLIYRVAKGVVTSAYRQNIQTLSGDPLITEVNTLEVNFMFVSGNSGGPIFDAETGRVNAFVHGFQANKIAENYVPTVQANTAQGASTMHIETLHAIYSVGIRLDKVRTQMEDIGVTL